MKKFLLMFVLLILAAFFLGPNKYFDPVEGEIKLLDIPLQDLDKYIADKEAKVKNIRPDNESRIIWVDSLRKTPYSIVYLHGFSASWFEGNGVHIPFAERYGCNLYLPRLAQHGIQDKETFGNMTPQEYLDSAKEAIAIGQLLGEKVIVMSCSTGSTLGIYLEAENPDLVAAQIMYSPNIDLGFATSELLTLPWGGPIANQLIGEYRDIRQFHSKEDMQYITAEYKTEGLIGLKALIEMTMTTKTFQKITKPYFVGYYYKNEEEKDNVISIEALLNFDKQTKTPAAEKRLVAFPDVKTHVVPNTVQSKDIASVQTATFKYAEEVLGLNEKW